MGIAKYDGPLSDDSKELSHEPILPIERDPDLHSPGDWTRLFPVLCNILPEDYFHRRFQGQRFSVRRLLPIPCIQIPVGTQSVESIDPVEAVEAVEVLYRTAGPFQLPSGPVHDFVSISVFEQHPEPEFLPAGPFLQESYPHDSQPDAFTGHHALEVPAALQPQQLHRVLRQRQSKPIHPPRHPGLPADSFWILGPIHPTTVDWPALESIQHPPRPGDTTGTDHGIPGHPWPGTLFHELPFHADGAFIERIFQPIQFFRPPEHSPGGQAGPGHHQLERPQRLHADQPWSATHALRRLLGPPAFFASNSLEDVFKGQESRGGGKAISGEVGRGLETFRSHHGHGAPGSAVSVSDGHVGSHEDRCRTDTCCQVEDRAAVRKESYLTGGGDAKEPSFLEVCSKGPAGLQDSGEAISLASQFQEQKSGSDRGAALQETRVLQREPVPSSRRILSQVRGPGPQPQPILCSLAPVVRIHLVFQQGLVESLWKVLLLSFLLLRLPRPALPVQYRLLAVLELVSLRILVLSLLLLQLVLFLPVLHA